MRKLAFIFFTMTFPFVCNGQITLSYNFGYGGYSMKDVKRQQFAVTEDFPVQAKVIDKFPPHWYHEVAIGIIKSRFYSGISCVYASTGGRVHYSDYSGELLFDQVAKTYGFAPQFAWTTNTESKLVANFGVKLPCMFSHYSMDFISRVGTQSAENVFEFTSFNIGVEPGISLSRKIISAVAFRFYAGYNIDVLKGDLFYEENNNAFLQDNQGDKIHLDWSGFRTSAGIMVSIK